MITVKLFGMTKSLAGNQSILTLALANGQSVKNVIELVNKRYPAIGELISKKKILVSVNQEIAHELVLTVNTVKRHISNIFDKLHVSNRVQAIAQARERNLI